MKFKKLLLVLPILPLLMGTTAAPSFSGEYYSDVSLEYLREEESDGGYLYYYTLDNYGTGYINHFDIEVYIGNHFVYSYLNIDNHSKPFKNSLIYPGYKKEVAFFMEDKKPIDCSPYLTSYAYYANASEAKVKGSNSISLISKPATINDSYVYEVDLFIYNKDDDHYDYATILDMTYKSEHYAIGVTYDNSKYRFETSEELDLNNIAVDKVTVVKSSNYNINCYSYSVWAILGDVFLILLIISPGIFAAIFVPAMVRKKRRNREKSAK